MWIYQCSLANNVFTELLNWFIHHVSELRAWCIALCWSMEYSLIPGRWFLRQQKQNSLLVKKRKKNRMSLIFCSWLGLRKNNIPVLSLCDIRRKLIRWQAEQNKCFLCRSCHPFCICQFKSLCLLCGEENTVSFFEHRITFVQMPFSSTSNLLNRWLKVNWLIQSCSAKVHWALNLSIAHKHYWCDQKKIEICRDRLFPSIHLCHWLSVHGCS